MKRRFLRKVVKRNSKKHTCDKTKNEIIEIIA